MNDTKRPRLLGLVLRLRGGDLQRGELLLHVRERLAVRRVLVTQALLLLAEAWRITRI